MSGRIDSWWQTLLAVGTPIFPYIGLVILVLLVVLFICVLLYLFYRLIRRVPPILRYVAWISSTLPKRWLAKRPARSQINVTAAFAGDGKLRSFDDSFGAKRYPWSRQLRPQVPLFVVVGAPGSGKSSMLRLATAYGDVDSSAAEQSDVKWWRLHQRLALELSPRIYADNEQARRASIVRTLQRFRPERPLDGVIAVLSATQLLENGERSREELMQMARIVTELSDVAGQRLPLYIVISGADQLPGFRECQRTLQGRLDEQSLHWLCTDARAAPHVEAAVLAWSQSVQAAIVSSLVAAPATDSIATLSKALVLPTQLALVHQPLVEWLTALKKSSDLGSAGVLLRGVLLAVLKEVGQDDAHGWGGGVIRSNLSFALPMAMPPAPGYLQRVRRQAIAGIAALVCSLILLVFWIPLALSSVRTEMQALNQVVLQTEGDILQAASGAYAASDLNRSNRLLTAVARVERASLGAVLAPGSWFDDSQELLMAALGRSIQKLLIAPRLKALEHDEPTLQAGQAEPQRAVEASRVEDLPAFERLNAFLGQRELVGMAVQKAESLPGGVSYQDLVWFLGEDTRKFTNPAWDWKASIPAQVVRRFDISEAPKKTNPELAPLVDALWERLLQEALDLHPIAALAAQANTLMIKLRRDPSWSYEDAIALRDCLRNLQREVERPQAQRLLGKPPEALRFIAKALARMSTSSIVPMKQYTDAAAEFGKRHDVVRRRLLSYDTEGLGRMFIQDAGEDKLALSQDLKRFAASYASLMGQPFMEAPLTAPLPDGADQVLTWDPSRTEVAKELAANMREYSVSGIQVFDPGMRPNLMRLSKQQFRRTFDAAFLRAAWPVERSERKFDEAGSTQASGQSRVYAENLYRAAQLYKQTLSFNEGGLSSTVASELLARQMLRQLATLESQLLQNDPYAPLVADALRWVRTASSGRALATTMRGNPKERLSTARENVRMRYGAEASQLLEGMTGLVSGLERDQAVQRWRRMTDTLEGFEKGASTNSLYELEQYILNLSKWTDPDECGGNLADRPSISKRSDYFSVWLARLDEEVTEACALRMVEHQGRKYEQFAQWFNSLAAGHAPFGGNSRLAPLSRRSFAAVLEKYRGMRKNMQGVPPDWPQPVAQFLSQMDQLSTRFALPEQDRAGAPAQVASALKARLRLRTNRSESVSADQIIGWSILTDKRQYGLHSDGEIFEWRIGEPIEVLLRWASNSLYAPVAGRNRDLGYTVEARTARFQFAGDWSMLELLQRHGKRGDGVDQVLLRFDVNVLGPTGRTVARAFITLEALDDQTPLILDFPQTAPALSAQTEDQNTQSKKESISK